MTTIYCNWKLKRFYSICYSLLHYYVTFLLHPFALILETEVIEALEDHAKYLYLCFSMFLHVSPFSCLCSLECEITFSCYRAVGQQDKEMFEVAVRYSDCSVHAGARRGVFSDSQPVIRELHARWWTGAGWLVMADVNSNARAEHVWAVVQERGSNPTFIQADGFFFEYKLS